MSQVDPPSAPATPSKLAGRLLVVAAALMWSSGGLFAKATLFDDWPVDVRGSMFAFWRAAFAAAVLLPAVRRPRWHWVLAPMVVAFALMNVTYLTSMTQSTAANAIWLQSTSPWWVFLLSVFLLGEQVQRRDLVPLGFAVLGVGTILSFELTQAHNPSRLGVILGLASGVCYAVVVICLRLLRTHGSVWLVMINHACTALVLVPWVMYLGRWPSPTQLAVLLAFGSLQMAVPYLLMTRGLRAVPSQEAVAIALLEPVLTPVWVFLVWGEQPASWTIFGAGCILVGLVLRYVVWELLWKTRGERTGDRGEG